MTTPTGKTCYAILGVDKNVSQDQIERAYADLLKTYNELPDGPLRRQRLEALEEAYLLLSNPIRRSVYDASLVAGQAPMMEIGMTVPGRVPSPVPEPAPRRSRGPLYFGLGLLTVFVVGYLALAFSQQRMFRDVQERALQSSEQVQERIRAQEAAMMAAERDAEGNPQAAAEARERYAREAEKRQAEYEARRRQSEFDSWNAEVRDREAREERDAKRAAEQRERELQQEARRAEQQEARDSQAARERADRDRRQLLSKLIAERRYAEAKQIVKDESELRQIEQAERYSR